MRTPRENDIIRLVIIALVFLLMFSLSSCDDSERLASNEFAFGYYYQSGDIGTMDYTIELSNKDAAQWDYSDSSLVILLIKDLTVGENWTGSYDLTGNEGIPYEIDAISVFAGAQWNQITQGYLEIRKKEGSYFELSYSLGDYQGIYNGELIEL